MCMVSDSIPSCLISFKCLSGMFEDYVRVVVGRMKITDSGSVEFASCVDNKTSTDYISQVGLLFCILYCREAYTIFRTGAPRLEEVEVP